MRIAIIGAGPSGLSAAYELTKKNVQVDIYESRKEVGGLAASLKILGQNLELGPHYLLNDTDKEVRSMIDELLNEKDLYHYKRLSRIFMGDGFIHYPPKPLTILKNLGIKNSILTLIAISNPFLKAAYKHQNSSFETYIKKSVGVYIYNKFFKEYTEKLWGISCSEINEDYAKSLIGLGNLGFLSLAKKILRIEKGKNHSDCIYPKQGMSMLWEAMKKSIEKQGGAFYFSAQINSIKSDNYVNIGLSNSNVTQYDYVISTIPDTKMLQLLNDTNTKKLINLSRELKFRDVIFVFLKIENADLITDNNIYIYNKTIKCIRITNYNRFKNLDGNDIIMLEYWMNEGDAMWSADNAQILQISLADISKLAPAAEIKIIDSEIIKLKNAFPIPDQKIRQVRSEVNDYLKRYEKLIRIGRSNQNNFNYGMEDALKEGIACAQNILKPL